MFGEFKKFAMRGSVIDLAVGVIIGASFTGIVNSLVKDIINPLLGLIGGETDFSNFFVVLKGSGSHMGPYATLAAAHEARAVTLNYGIFINAIINFLIVAAVLFMVVRQLNRLKAPPPPAAAPAVPEDVALLREIRDVLKARG